MTSGVAFPYGLGAGGQTACVSSQEYLRQLLAQIVFVEPGERVNRPTFGCRLRSLTFESGKTEITAAGEGLVESALRQWVGEGIEVRGVEVEVKDERVWVTIAYCDEQSRLIHQISISS